MSIICQNSFEIKGSEEDIAKLKEAVLVTIDSEDATEDQIAKSYLTNDNKRMFFDFNGIVPIPEELIQIKNLSSAGLNALKLLNLRNNIPFKDVLYHKDKNEIIEFAENEFKLNEVGNINTDELCNIFLNMETEQKTSFLRQCSIDIDLGKKYLDNITKYGFPDAIGFCIEEWGTRHNAEFLILNKDTPTEFSGSFTTLHKEPQQFWHRVIRKFPNLEVTVRYFEPIIGNAGTISKSGKNTELRRVYADELHEFGKKYFGYEYPKD